MTARKPALRRTRGPVSARERELFLEALRAGFSITAAATKLSRDRRRFYELGEDDPDFKSAMQEAVQEGIDHLEDELVRAGTEGWTEIDVIEERGDVVRRVARQRKDPRLLAKVREWRRPPEVEHVAQTIIIRSVLPPGIAPYGDAIEVVDAPAIEARVHDPDAEAVEIPAAETGAPATASTPSDRVAGGLLPYVGEADAGFVRSAVARLPTATIEGIRELAPRASDPRRYVLAALRRELGESGTS